jgi:two-component system, NtrC family, response regulator
MIMSRILIVDDSEIMCTLLNRVVKSLGHETHTASTIQRGLSLAGELDFDVVFLDAGLPDGNGIDYIPQLRDGKSSPEIIIITGQTNQEGAELAIKSGDRKQLSNSAADIIANTRPKVSCERIPFDNSKNVLS